MLPHEKYPHSRWAKLDLSSKNAVLSSLHMHADASDPLSLSVYIQQQLSVNSDCQVGWGGYGERRSLYKSDDPSNLFGGDGSEVRNIHLGIDVWSEAGTAITSPLSGTVVACTRNEGMGNYGPTLIIRVDENECPYHILLGHLGGEALDRWKIGDRVAAGTQVGTIGKWEENGNWPPHLHLQIIKNLPDNATDYEGVCSERLWPEFSANCPDPLPWLLKGWFPKEDASSAV
jgi:peptidoglycan LD-endopeptidase LytH